MMPMLTRRLMPSNDLRYAIVTDKDISRRRGGKIAAQ